MNNRRSLAVPFAACLLASCASQPSTKAGSDVGNVALATAPPVAARPQAPQLLQEHLNNIQVCRQLIDSETEGLQIAQSLYEAGRVGAWERAASEAKVTRAKMGLIDAQLALLRSGLVLAGQALPPDAAGNAPVGGALPAAADLLDEKLALAEMVVQQARDGHAIATELYRAGRGTMTQVQTAKLHLLDAEKERNDVRREREAAGSS